MSISIGDFQCDVSLPQLPEPFSFVLCYLNLVTPVRFDDNIPNLQDKTSNYRLLVVAVKKRHRENGLITSDFSNIELMPQDRKAASSCSCTIIL